MKSDGRKQESSFKKSNHVCLVSIFVLSSSEGHFYGHYSWCNFACTLLFSSILSFVLWSKRQVILRLTQKVH